MIMETNNWISVIKEEQAKEYKIYMKGGRAG